MTLRVASDRSRPLAVNGLRGRAQDLRFPVGAIHAYRDGDAETLCGEPLGESVFPFHAWWNRMWLNMCVDCERVACEQGA
jgi:hypothetical protein